MVQPRPMGRQTKVIITEYELPRLDISGHDTGGDAQGRVWYSTHRSSYVGRLNPANGHVEEFHVPLPPQANALPGTHWIFVDPKGRSGARRTGRTTSGRSMPKTEGLQARAVERAGAGQLADGRQLRARRRRQHLAPPRGRGLPHQRRRRHKMEAIKTKKFASTYGSAMSWDHRYFGGGAWPKDGVVVYDRKTGELFEADTSPNSGPGARRVRSARAITGRPAAAAR